MNHFVLLLSCNDRPGIVHEITSMLLDLDANNLDELNNLKKIESLEKELINNLDENSYSELIKLKSQVNRE
mgnify:CR=1 FL=1